MVTLEKTSPGSSEHDAPSISESTLPVPEIMDAAPSGDNIPKLDNPVDDRHEKQGDALLTEDAKGQEPRIDTERMKDEDDVGINNELKSESATNDEDGKENRHDDENERTLSEDEAEETLRLMRVNIASKKQRRSSDPIDDDDEIEQLASIQVEESKDTDPIVLAQIDLMKKSTPSSDLEIAYNAALYRKQVHLDRLTSEILKLKQFISKRKQTYKRKRKEDGAPTRALSAYNIFIQDRFAKLAKENENALKSEDKDATMKRVPPASLVAATGNAWKTLSNDEKQKYEERAKSDRKRYEDQMAEYQPPDKQSNRKRNKTGYNMFFSAHVLRLKQTESGVPSERGSVARLVGTAWKMLAADDKAYYEREADKHNGMNPIKEAEEEDEEEEIKRQHMEYHMHATQQHHGAEMAMHAGMPPPMHGIPHPHHDVARQPHPQHHGYYPPPPHMYAPPQYAHYDYSQHHQRHQQARAQGYQQYPPSSRNPYEG